VSKPAWIWIALLATCLGCGAGGDGEPAAHEDRAHAPHSEASHSGESHAEEPERGPHGGRLFSADDVQLELQIAEEDGPPVFVAYVNDANGRPLQPQDVSLDVSLKRFGNRHETLRLEPAGGHWRSQDEVREPHSFAASIELQDRGHQHEWQYEQVEFRVELSPEAVRMAGIEVGPVGPARIDVRVTAPGEVRLNGERVLLVRPRFPGVITELRKRLGDAVASNDTLAIIQSNESLQDYAIVASVSGSIVSRTGTVGAAVDHESVLYTLADLSSVWVDFAIYPQNVGVVRRGQEALITPTMIPDLQARGPIAYVGPLLEQDTRASYGRVILPNPDGRWQPGLYVTVNVLVEKAEVALAVPEEAIVRSRFGPAVFLADGATFELQPVSTGRTDGRTTEITAGLAPGLHVAFRNAFLLKAELGKSEATHDH
jgi:cobalt-zinc-cadmium efflux system membrane fusion protein